MSQTDMTKADKKANKNELRDTIVVIVEALLIALVFRTFLYQPFSIPTASMQSTLMIGDYFIADKFIWGFGKYSFPIPLPFNGRFLQFSEPKQGDIAVFARGPMNGSDGHVGFLVADEGGPTVKILGGNQSNRVCYQTYPKDGNLGSTRYRLLGIRRG